MIVINILLWISYIGGSLEFFDAFLIPRDSGSFLVVTRRYKCRTQKQLLPQSVPTEGVTPGSAVCSYTGTHALPH
jgi:hypothetical protein